LKVFLNQFAIRQKEYLDWYHTTKKHVKQGAIESSPVSRKIMYAYRFICNVLYNNNIISCTCFVLYQISHIQIVLTIINNLKIGA